MIANQKLRVRYRTSEEEVTERLISDIQITSMDRIEAYCHLRCQQQTFVLARIDRAWKEETGEVIEDIWVHLGLPSGRPPRPSMPQFPEQYIALPIDEAHRLRNEDKRNLFRCFQNEALKDIKRVELFSLFAHRCFKCARVGPMHMDHHVPQALGGRLVPGNVVLLCPACNELKADHHPNEFYSAQELERLMPILKAQLPLFDFKFNWNLWGRDPVAYLTALGVSEEVAIRAARERESGIGISFSVTLPLSND